ncbi:MAG: glutamate mutase L [Candidatus Xenobia bacterium]
MPALDPSQINSIVATDCGSTTTKAILIEKRDGEYRLVTRGEAPTTVEAPVEDVTQGVLNAIAEVQELAGRQILDGEQIIKPKVDDRGVDIYISTSSAGGGLQMMVAGVVKQMTAESAQRAALGAGAIVMDTLAANDKRLPHQRIERIRKLRPDMVLLSGGVDGGTVKHVVELAEIISAADPKPRLGMGYQLPVIYAGNQEAREDVQRILGSKTALIVCDNLRPTMEQENLMPARREIQTLFLEHVMAQAPGYRKLMGWTDVEIMPTPAAVGNIMQRIAERDRIQVVGIDIGGATTDVFSVFSGVFNRTVSANYGMSYSISNVFADAGMEAIMRWVPFDIDERDLRNRIKNKMIRPTTIPQLLEELVIEQALAREALRLSFEQHKALATGLKGVQQERTIGDVFDQQLSGQTLVNMMGLNMIIGSGGVLSHAPRRNQSAMMMIDAFLPEGVTRLTVDSIFMMPQLGVLAEVHPVAATQVFEKDCLIHLGTCVAPVGPSKEGRVLARGTMGNEEVEIKSGDLFVKPLAVGKTETLRLKPERGIDLGAGKGQEISETVYGGVVGVIFDGRGRQPFTVPAAKAERIAKLTAWNQALDMYPNREMRYRKREAVRA